MVLLSEDKVKESSFIPRLDTELSRQVDRPNSAAYPDPVTIEEFLLLSGNEVKMSTLP
jgi:hypothetical protein